MAKKILCIDSDIETQDRVSEYLSNQGYIVTKQYKGKNAVDAIEKASPHLIILAVELPDVNGYVVCKLIKTHPKLKNVPLILTSSEATPEDFEKHSNLKSRADKYLLKPFDNEELSIKIQNLLEERVEKSEVEIDVEVEKEPHKGLVEEEARIKKKAPPKAAVSEEIQKELKKAREEALSLSREKTELESKLSQERARGKELEEKLSETKKVLNEKLHETTKNLEEVRQERDEFKARHKRLFDDLEHLRSEQKSSRDERGKYFEEINNLKKENETLLESLKVAQGLNERNNEELEAARHKIEYLEQGNQVAEDMEVKILAMDEEIKEKEKALEDALSLSNHFENGLKEKEKILEDVLSRCKSLEESLSAEKEEHAALQIEMEKKLSALQEKIHNIEEEVEAGEALTSRILVLEEEALESSKYLQALQEKIDAAIKERDDFRLQCESLVEQHQKSLEQMDADFTKEKGDLTQKLSLLEEKIRTLTESQEALSREKETLDQDHKALQTEFSLLKDTLKENEESLLQITDAREKDMAYMKEELSKKEGELASLKESLANKEQELAQVSSSSDALRTEKDVLSEETKALKEQMLNMEKGLLEMGPLNERIKALEKSLEEAVRQRDEYYQHSLRIYEDAERLRKELEAAYSAAPQGAPPSSSPPPPVSSASAPLPEPPSFEESFESLETSLEDLDK